MHFRSYRHVSYLCSYKFHTIPLASTKFWHPNTTSRIAFTEEKKCLQCIQILVFSFSYLLIMVNKTGNLYKGKRLGLYIWTRVGYIEKVVMGEFCHWESNSEPLIVSLMLHFECTVHTISTYQRHKIAWYNLYTL